MNDLSFSVNETDSISFWDYKIDYNHCLGSGVYGTVYKVIKRPENEKGYLSYLAPYFYDYVFSVKNKKEDEKTDLCIKISKIALRVFVENIDNNASVIRALESLFESSNEFESNCLMQKYGLTKIKFYKSNSLYSQFKTLVNGHTFEFYLIRGSFSACDQYRLRKAFVCFLQSILNPRISLLDFHRKNIMYDELKVRWEVVDGHIYELKDSFQVSEKNDNIMNLLGYFNLNLPSHPITQTVFSRLSKAARRGLSYNEEMDQNLLRKVSLLNAKNI